MVIAVDRRSRDHLGGAELAPVDGAPHDPLDRGGVHGGRVLAHRLVEARDLRGAAVADDDPPLVAEDLQVVRSHHVVGRGDEDARAVTPVVEHGGDVVVHGDVVREAEGRLGVDAPGRPAEPLPQVDLVGRLIDEDAAPLASPRAPQGRAVEVPLEPEPVGDHPGAAAQVADLAVRDDLLQPGEERVGALVEHGAHDHGRGLLGHLEHPAHLFGVDAERLLHQHVQSARHRRHRDLRVGVVGDRRDDGVHGAALHHRDGVGEVGHVTEALLRGRFGLRAAAAEGAEGHVRHLPGPDEPGVEGPLATSPDDAQADRHRASLVRSAAARTCVRKPSTWSHGTTSRFEGWSGSSSSQIISNGSGLR